MYSKKINELATNLNPQSSDLIPIGDAVTGQLKTTTFGNIFGTSADGIISGGVVTWSGTGLVFNVTSCQYSLSGIRYTTAATTITLTAADPTNARIDVIAVNTSSQVVLITGTPSANPIEPQVDPFTQIQLTNITVNAGATTPNISSELIYDENVETWTKTHSGLTSINFASTVDPYVGSKCIAATFNGYASDKYIQFTSPTTLNSENYSVIKFAIKLSRPLTYVFDSIYVSLRVYGTENTYGLVPWIVMAGPNATNVAGFDYTSTSWQLISVPIVESFSFTDLVFFVKSYNSPLTINIDRIELQNINNQYPIEYSKSFGIVQTSSGAATALIPTDTLTISSSGLTTLSATGKTLTIATPSPIPSQTGNANKALTTNGTTLSWGVVPVNKAGDTMTGNLILNANPSTALGAATKDYVDTLINGIDWKQSANAGTVAALPTYSVSGSGQILTGTANGAIPSATTDNYTLLAGNRVLVKNETNALTPNNGIYVVTQVGSGSLPFILTRSSDANTSALLAEATISINNGTTLANTQWHSNPASLPITIGTTNITFNQIGSGVYTAGSGLTLTGNIFSIATNGVTDAMIQSATNWNTAYTNRITSATSPLSITSNTISIQQASASQNGYLSSTDWNTFNSKQSALTLTTTGTSGAATLVGNTLNIPQYSGGASIGGAVTSGTTGSILFINPTATLAQDNANLFWDDTNDRLGVGINVPLYRLDVNGTGRYQDNLLVSKNQNAGTSLEISNTTSGTTSQAFTLYTSDASSGNVYFGKRSSAITTFGIIAARDSFILNGVAGDIAIANNVATGTIKFAAGASTTAQAVIKTTGQLQLNNYTSTSSFTGTAAGYLAFDSSGNILSAAVPSSSTVTFNRQTSSYTLVLGDAGKMIEMNVGTANNLTVPLNSSVAFPTGTQIDVTQYGAGQTTFVATAGVTIRSTNGWLKMNAQYGAATLVKVGTDEWYLFGNINA